MGTGSNYTTVCRRNIIEFFKNNYDKTVTAFDIKTYLENIDCDVNMTTIYRYLDKLTKDGNLNKYSSDHGGPAVYQYIENNSHCEEHLHLKCVNCGRIIHLDCTFMHEISEHISKEHGFNIQCRNSIIYGLCRECEHIK